VSQGGAGGTIFGSGDASAGSGGSSSTGGTVQSGGRQGTGGASANGGAAAGTGGTVQSGGRQGTGGTSANGGTAAGTGGTVAGTGGTVAGTGGTAAGTGGTTAGTGGTAAGTGGTAAGTGGTAAGTGGTVGSGGAIASTASIQLSGNKILDAKGSAIVARGPEDVVASASQTKEIDQIAGLGANAMRMLFTLDAANAMTPSGFDALLASAVSHHMLVWVSLYTWDSAHSNAIASALGGGNFYSLTAPAGTTACSSSTPASCYLAVWSRQWLKDLMNKYRSNIIIDAGQEFINPGDASSEAARTAWAAAAKSNIQVFRGQGYTNPLEIMANFQGRDLYCIVEYGEAIRAADTVSVNGEPQTMFGWQAYWGTTDQYYQKYQGALLLGQSQGTISAADAIHQFVLTRTFPIEIGIDNYPADTNQDYQAEIDQAATDGMSWLWWSWKDSTVECPASGSTCQTYVTTSQNGFKGAKPLSN
jgi:hypothetical protein